MATRANIIIQQGWKKSFTLYHHLDGYPDELGVKLQALCEHLNQSSYPLDAMTIANYLIKGNVMEESYLNDGDRFREDDGFEITEGLHGDIEYLYKIFVVPYLTVVCYEVQDFLEETRTFHRVPIPESHRQYKFK